MDAVRNATILIVDEEHELLQALEDAFAQADAQAVIVKSSDREIALQVAAKQPPNLVITGWGMPQTDAIQLIRQLRIEPMTRDIPVIMCSGEMTRREDLKTALKAGVIDFLRKPMDPVELIARSNSMLQLGASIKKSKEQHSSLQEAYKKLEHMARTDPLTKLSNRRGFLENLAHEGAVSDRTGRPFALAIGDIDRFKRVNDQYGHDCGDRVLVSVAETIQKTIRKQDYVGRWGGEEFILVFPDTHLNGGHVIAEKIRDAISGLEFQCQNQSFSISMSLGCCVYDEPEDMEICLKRADMALYRGKQQGRNQVAT